MSSAAALLQGIHLAISWGRGPHWLLNDTDAKAYGQALANALRHLPITTSQKYVDFTVLGLAIVTHTTPRVVMDMQLRAQRQAQSRRPSQGPAQVFQFRPNAAPPSPSPPAAEPPAPPSEAPAAWSPDMTYEPDFEGAAN